jgi:hypothetical protein
MDIAFFKEAIKDNLSDRTLDLFQGALDIKTGPPWDGSPAGIACLDDLTEALFAEIDPSLKSEMSMRGRKWLLKIKLEKLAWKRASTVENHPLPPPGPIKQHPPLQAAFSRPNAASYVSTMPQSISGHTYSDSGRSDTASNISSPQMHEHTPSPRPSQSIVWADEPCPELDVLPSRNYSDVASTPRSTESMIKADILDSLRMQRDALALMTQLVLKGNATDGSGAVYLSHLPRAVFRPSKVGQHDWKVSHSSQPVHHSLGPRCSVYGNMDVAACDLVRYTSKSLSEIWREGNGILIGTPLSQEVMVYERGDIVAKSGGEQVGILQGVGNGSMDIVVSRRNWPRGRPPKNCHKVPTLPQIGSQTALQHTKDNERSYETLASPSRSDYTRDRQNLRCTPQTRLVQA